MAAHSSILHGFHGESPWTEEPGSCGHMAYGATEPDTTKRLSTEHKTHMRQKIKNCTNKQRCQQRILGISKVALTLSDLPWLSSLSAFYCTLSYDPNPSHVYAKISTQSHMTSVATLTLYQKDSLFKFQFCFTFSTTSIQFSSFAQLCPTLCDPMNHSTPGLSVHHQLPEFTQTHVHRVGDAIQSSHPLPSPSPPAPNPSQNQGLFQSGQSIGVSASASILPMNNRD